MKRIHAVVALLTLTACAPEAPGLPAEEGAPADVVVSSVARASSASIHPAVLAAARTARIATRTSGRIERVEVDVGTRVATGDTLVVLDAEDVLARLEAARAQATLAERSLRRVESLAADRAATRQELDEARARLETARSELSAARNQLDYVVVLAPFDGVVEARTAEPGDLAAPGVPLLSLVGRGSPIVEAELPSRFASSLRPGDPVTVLLPHDGTAHSATVTRVGPALEPESRRVRVEARFAGPPVAVGPPGTYVRLAVPAAEDETAWIPADAVVRTGQLEGVYALEGSEVRLRWLRLGRRSGDAVEVLAGPSGLEAVVRSPHVGLTDGTPVGRVERRPWSPDGEDGSTSDASSDGGHRDARDRAGRDRDGAEAGRVGDPSHVGSGS